MLFQTFDLLRDFLSLNRKKFQSFLRETEVFSGILSQFLGVFKDSEREECGDETRKYQKIVEVLKLCLRNNDENMKIFENFNLFTLLITKNKEESFEELIVFFLEEQAKKANLEPFLIVLLKAFNENTDFAEKIRVSEYFFQLISDRREGHDIFRDAICKKFRFLHKFIDLVVFFDVKHEHFERNLALFLRKLKKHLTSDKFFLKYARKKSLFLFLFKKLRNLLQNMPNQIQRLIICHLFNFSIKDNNTQKESKDPESRHIFLKIAKKSMPLVIFPEIISFIFEYLAKLCEVPLQKDVIEETLKILMATPLNPKSLSQSNLLETLGLVFQKEMKTSLHPFYESLLRVLLELVAVAPRTQDIALIEAVLLGINQEVIYLFNLLKFHFILNVFTYF